MILVKFYLKKYAKHLFQGIITRNLKIYKLNFKPDIHNVTELSTIKLIDKHNIITNSMRVKKSGKKYRIISVIRANFRGLLPKILHPSFEPIILEEI